MNDLPPTPYEPPGVPCLCEPSVFVYSAASMEQVAGPEKPYQLSSSYDPSQYTYSSQWTEEKASLRKHSFTPSSYSKDQ